MTTPADWRRRRSDAAARLPPLRSGHRDPDGPRTDAPDSAYAAWERQQQRDQQLWERRGADLTTYLAEQAPVDDIRDQAPAADQPPAGPPDAPTANPAPPDPREPVLTQLAHEHRQQPDKLRHDFRGYDRHLRLDCPLCLVCGEMPSSVRPGELNQFTELMLP